MENLNTIEQALDKATQKGAFTLAETGLILNAVNNIKLDLQKKDMELADLKEYKRRTDELKGAMKETPLVKVIEEDNGRPTKKDR